VSRPHFEGAEQEVGTRAVFVRSSGQSGVSRPAAVMVHGLGGQSTNWTDLMHELAELDCYALDLPGFGWSPPPSDADYSLTASADVVATLVQELSKSHDGPLHLFGNSLGGVISILVAAARPDLVRSLTLISPALPDLRPRRDTMGIPAVALPGVGRRLYHRMGKVSAERQVAAMLALNYGDATVVTPERREEAAAEVARRLALPHSGDAMSAAARSLLTAYVARGQRSLWAAARRVSCPTLILYGGRDRLVDPKRSLRAARALPHARVMVLTRLGHVAQLEDPALVARMARPMLAAS
jgi:pimeloyl-ACP methyl ester carboxylesterase